MEIIDRPRYVNKVLEYLGKGLIIVLTGQRRVGKSCILQYVGKKIKEDTPDAHIVYINKEYAEFNTIGNDGDLNAYITKNLRDDVPNYLLIDEVQDID